MAGANIWKDTGMEVFSKSTTEVNDEEALKWAALERLPTYNRVRRGLLINDEGKSQEINIKNLGPVERKNLVERLLKIGKGDNGNFLLKQKERIERVGLHLPTIEVRFENLSVEANAYVGSRALPTVFNFTANIIEGFLGYLHILPSQKKQFPVLHDVSGIIKPGRMTLLLGPPSSGKTTLLLALSGKLDQELNVSGRITYNGHEMNEFVPQRTSAYISQQDKYVSVKEFSEAFRLFHIGQKIGEELSIPFDKKKSHHAALTTHVTVYESLQFSASLRLPPDVDVH